MIGPRVDGDVLSVVADALREEGLPEESAVKFAHIAVEVVRGYLWRMMPCTCDEVWTSRGLRDPQCSVHDYDQELGGDGNGSLLTVEREREQLIATAVRLQQQYGEEVYQRVFAPAYAALLEQVNRRGLQR